MSESTATIRVHASTQVDAERRGKEELAAYFGDGAFDIIDTDAKAMVTMGGSVLAWQVDVTARYLPQSSRPSPDR